MTEKIGVDHFLRQRYITALKASPDEKTIAMVVRWADMERNDYPAELWLYDLASDSYRPLTACDPTVPFAWLDGQSILFGGARTGASPAAGVPQTAFCRIDIATGETEDHMHIPLAVSALHPLGGGRFLLAAQYSKSASTTPCLAGQGECEVADEMPYRLDGAGNINGQRTRLYLYSSKEDSCLPLTGEDETVRIADIQGDTVLYISERIVGKRNLSTALYTCQCSTQKRNCLLSGDKGFTASLAAFLGGRVVVCGIQDAMYQSIAKNRHFYWVENGCLIPLARHDFGLDNRVFSDHYGGEAPGVRVYGGALYFLSTEYRGSFVKRLTHDGEIATLTVDAGAVNSFELCGGRLYFAGYRSMRPQELYRMDEDGERQLTAFHDEAIPKETVMPHERICFENDGVALEGYVLKPRGFDSGKQYAGILNIHGGPKTVFAPIYYHEMQMWANEGYFVFFCNPRGSEGRGEAFADINGRYGTVDYSDIMKFTDLVLERYPQLDPGHLGVTGISYGGFMANWIIGHTGRFRCAIPESGIASWSSMLTADIGYYLTVDMMQATLWDAPEVYWQGSPLKYAPQVKTPALFIHGQNDYRCPLPEAVQMYTALKFFGVEARLCVFKEEDHCLAISGRPANRIRRMEEILSWFDRYLK